MINLLTIFGFKKKEYLSLEEKFKLVEEKNRERFEQWKLLNVKE